MTVLCIHHRDLDGWGAAASIPGVDEYFGVSYNYDKHTELLNMCGNKDVVIVDFSFPLQVMKNIQDVAKGLIWIDHHDSAKKNKLPELGLPGIFDMDDAGCRLAWKFFHPDEKMPKAIYHAGDRDIWQFKDPNTRAFCFALSVLPGIEDPGSATWKALLEDEMYDQILEAGKFIERTVDNDNLWRKRLGLFRKEKIFLINATSQISELASDILKDYGQDKLVIVWRANKNRMDLSFRGTGAQDMAETFGGGGHPEAAGASMKVQDGMKFVADLMSDMYPV